MSEKPANLRERHAQQTRSEILRAARVLFAERGYTRTSVRDVARAAGVSAQTVYDSLGSKSALVAHLNDQIDAEANVSEIARTTMESGNPEQVAALSAAITRSILENCGDILHALVTGAAAEPALERVLVEGNRRHQQGAEQVVGALERMGALTTSVTRPEAVDSLAAVTDFRFAQVLRDSYGWSLDRVEAWMVRMSRTLLLAD